MSRVLPPIDALLPAYAERASVRKYADMNFSKWRRIVGSLRALRADPRDFEPRGDYWQLYERRALVAYFGKVHAEQYVPAAALRSLAYGVFRHFDTVRRQGGFGGPMDAGEQNNDWPRLADRLREVARAVPEMVAEFSALHAVWGTKAVGGTTLRESLDAFLVKTKELSIAEAEKVTFAGRLAWFPYLGLEEPGSLYGAQGSFTRTTRCSVRRTRTSVAGARRSHRCSRTRGFGDSSTSQPSGRTVRRLSRRDSWRWARTTSRRRTARTTTR